MKRVIGILLLIAIFTGMFIFTAFMAGIKLATILWIIAITIAALIFLAVYLTI